MAEVAHTAQYPDLPSGKLQDSDMASGGFPEVVYDLTTGLLATVTAAGGSQW